MKQRYSLVLVAILLFSFSLPAQITLIPKGGLSLGNAVITKRGSHSTSPGTGVTAGVGCNLAAGKIPWLSFQPELSYVQKAYTFRQTTTVPMVGVAIYNQTTSRKHYLEMPLLVRAGITKRNLRAFVTAGPSVGYLLDSGGKTKLVIGGQPVEITEEMLVPVVGKVYNSFEASLQLGGGIGFPLGSGTLLLEARYGVGLTHFVREHQVLMPFGPAGEPGEFGALTMPADEKSRTFIFTCGYAIPLTK